MASPVMHVKLSILNGKGAAVEMRRFALPAETTLEELQRAVHEMTKPKATDFEAVRLMYQDTDGDKVMLGCPWEWEECLRVGGGSYCDPRTPLRLYVNKRDLKKKSGGGGAVVEEGTTRATEPQAAGATSDEEYFYHSDGTAQAHDATRLNVMKNTVKGVLGEYTAGGTLPEFLHGAIRTCEEGLDVNINAVADALSRQGLVEMSNAQYEAASKHLQDSFVLKPTYVTRYNLACCYAQQGIPERALEALREAVEMGYANVAHMREDEDLVSLHGNQEFHELLAAMAVNQTPPTDPTAAAATAPAEDRPLEREESIEVVDLETPEQVEPAPVMEPEAPTTTTVGYSQELARLVEMGFPEAESRQALEATHGDHRAAANMLLEML